MDEVSLPIVLAWWLGRTSAADWRHVRAAAHYVVTNGPTSPHGQLIRLAWSIDAGEPIERPSIVACRYTGEGCG